MITVSYGPSHATVHATPGATHEWANTRPYWPCSTLQLHEVEATFDTNGLVDYRIDGKYPDEDEWIDGHEFTAFCADALRGELPRDHPVYFVAVGQFEGGS